MTSTPSPATSFTGRRALVIGGSSGMGKTTARIILERGGRVVLVARDRPRLTEARAELSALGDVVTHACDITYATARHALIASLER